MSIALLLAPDLALIVIGVLLKRFVRWPASFWEGLEQLVYYVLFPALLFVAIARTRFELGELASFLGIGLGAVVLGVALGFAARPLLRPPERLFASGVQCAFRFNSYVALALAQRLAGDSGVALLAVLLGFAVPLANIFAVLPLARASGGAPLREMLRNPLIVATLGGLLFNFAGATLPDPLAATLTRLGQAALALGLIAVGAGLRYARVPDSRALIAWVSTVKLLAMPAAAWFAGRAAGLEPTALTMAVMFAAMPTASSAYILATRMNGHGPLVASMITASTLGSLITLPAWLALAAPR